MKNFPMFLKMDGRRVILCGGGEEVARKAMAIAADICVYTNGNLTVETISA